MHPEIVMACTYDWTPRCVVKTFSGFVSAVEFIESAETVGADPRFDELRLIINDLSAIEGHAIDAPAYLHVAATRIGAMQTNANYRVAFVVRPGDARGFEETFRSGLQGMPFDPVVVATMAQARGWMPEAAVFNDPAFGC